MRYRGAIKRRLLEVMGDPRVVTFIQSERFVTAVARAVELGARASELRARWRGGRVRAVVAWLDALSHGRRHRGPPRRS